MTLQEFISKLERKKELIRIKHPVSAVLEITEIADRVMRKGGPALLFEQVNGYHSPVLINAFGSHARMSMVCGGRSPDEIAQSISNLLKPTLPLTWWEKIKTIPKLMDFANLHPRLVKHAPCQEVVEEKPLLDAFPILKCWPQDGGHFITLPVVITKNPLTGRRNAGMYRMQVLDARSTALHWHTHKDATLHYTMQEQERKNLEVAVVIGPEPAVTYAATAPLPEDIDEFVFAAFLQKSPVPITKCRTIDLEVPANSQIVLEGYVKPHERVREGPFGDHTGFYSPTDEFPIFHITCVTTCRNPIYHTTVVGPPPKEDCFMAKASERIFLPVMKVAVPEIIDINLPIEGVFHNLALVSIHKTYPGQAKKVATALWGLGGMSLTKVIVIVDGDVDVQNCREVLWKALNNIDPQRDIMFIEGPVDILDHAAPFTGYGSKMVVDATKKMKQEGYPRQWPDVITMDQKVVEKVNSMWKSLGIKL